MTDAMIAKVSPVAPYSMVDNYLTNLYEDVKKQNNGEDLDEEKVRETYRPAAERNLKWYLIRKRLIEDTTSSHILPNALHCVVHRLEANVCKICCEICFRNGELLWNTQEGAHGLGKWNCI